MIARIRNYFKKRREEKKRKADFKAQVAKAIEKRSAFSSDGIKGLFCLSVGDFFIRELEYVFSVDNYTLYCDYCLTEAIKRDKEISSYLLKSVEVNKSRVKEIRSRFHCLGLNVSIENDPKECQNVIVLEVIQEVEQQVKVIIYYVAFYGSFGKAVINKSRSLTKVSRYREYEKGTFLRAQKTGSPTIIYDFKKIKSFLLDINEEEDGCLFGCLCG